MQQQPTIPLYYALPVLNELAQMGFTRECVFRDAGIESCFPDGPDENELLSAMDFTRLYAYAFRLLEAETSQRADHSHIDKEVVDMMCYCAINCADLAEVIERVTIFTRIVNARAVSLELHQQATSARLVMDLRRSSTGSASRLVCLAAMNVFHQLFSWLIGQRIQLTAATLKYPAPSDYMPMAELFGVPIDYDQREDAFSFSAHYLEQPVVRSYAELQRIIDYFPFDIWFSGEVTGSMTDRVRILLMSALQHQRPLPSAESIAQLFHLGAASLRRRLREEQTHYAQIKADCQREYAEYLLRFSNLAVQEIAARLGFTDDRSFRRAFRIWNNCSPREFRVSYSD